MACGYLLSAAAGLLTGAQFVHVLSSPWVALPHYKGMFSLDFRWSLLPTFAIVSITGEEVDLVAGEMVRHPLEADKPVLWTDLQVEEMEGLAEVVKRDERAITIPVNDVTGVGGLVKPKDHVDLIGTFETENYSEVSDRVGTARGMSRVPVDTATITLLQNVTVLATGRSLSEGLAGLGRGGPGYSNVTLLVTPEEAQMLVFCLKRGEITLSLRNPEDFTVAEALEKTTDEAILNQLWPNRLTKERRIRMQIYERGVEVKD